MNIDTQTQTIRLLDKFTSPIPRITKYAMKLWNLFLNRGNRTHTINISFTVIFNFHTFYFHEVINKHSTINGKRVNIQKVTHCWWLGVLLLLLSWGQVNHTDPSLWVYVEVLALMLNNKELWTRDVCWKGEQKWGCLVHRSSFHCKQEANDEEKMLLRKKG